MKNPMMAWFYGAGPSFMWSWGGALTSPGITALATKAIALGIPSKCFNFADVADAEAWYGPPVDDGADLLLAGYSLGVSAITYLAKKRKAKRLFSICGSTLGRNYPISGIERSRAWFIYGSTLSGWGPGQGFTELTNIPPVSMIDIVSHLAAQSAPGVVDGMDCELRRYLDGG